MLTFHISLKTLEFFGFPYFLVTKKNFYQNFRILFEYVPEYVSYVFLDTERELDLVQSQVFLEVEKNPFFYHNLLTLNFNTDLGSKWLQMMVYSIKRTFRHYFMVKQGVKKVLRTFYQVIFLKKAM